jgi:hypothetical protein
LIAGLNDLLSFRYTFSIVRDARSASAASGGSMTDTFHPDRRLAKLDDVTRRPIAITSVGPRPSVERRNLPQRRALTDRVLSEFDEMPGTCLTLPQATRLFGVPPEVCHRILNELVGKGLLRRTADSRFRLSAA